MGVVSHDSVNRFLLRERFEPSDLYHEVSPHIMLEGGILSIDDSVLDKPYTDPKNHALVDYYWSGKHHGVVKGINIITLFYTDRHGIMVPVNYRVYDKSKGKTKNNYFLEMLDEVLDRGLKPAWVTGDCWYSSLKNLKHIRKRGLDFLFGIESNRSISIEKGKYIQARTLSEWPEDGRVIYLKEFGNTKIFRQKYKNTYRYYIIGMSELKNLDGINRVDFIKIHEQHWNIERFHRAIKQTCNIEKFQVRNQYAVMTHIYCAFLGFVRLEFLSVKQVIHNWYQLKKDLFVGAIKGFISKRSLLASGDVNYKSVVNA